MLCVMHMCCRIKYGDQEGSAFRSNLSKAVRAKQKSNVWSSVNDERM